MGNNSFPVSFNSGGKSFKPTFKGNTSNYDTEIEIDKRLAVQILRATEQEWTEVDPILRAGEPALSTDTYQVKIGDGKSHWSKLDYLGEREYKEIMEYIEENTISSISIDGIPLEVNEGKVDISFTKIDCGTSTTVI